MSEELSIIEQSEMAEASIGKTLAECFGVNPLFVFDACEGRVIDHQSTKEK